MTLTPSQAAILLRALRAQRAHVKRTATRGNWHPSEVAVALAELDDLEEMLSTPGGAQKVAG